MSKQISENEIILPASIPNPPIEKQPVPEPKKPSYADAIRKQSTKVPSSAPPSYIKVPAPIPNPPIEKQPDPEPKNPSYADAIRKQSTKVPSSIPNPSNTQSSVKIPASIPNPPNTQSSAIYKYPNPHPYNDTKFKEFKEFIDKYRYKRYKNEYSENWFNTLSSKEIHKISSDCPHCMQITGKTYDGKDATRLATEIKNKNFECLILPDKSSYNGFIISVAHSKFLNSFSMISNRHLTIQDNFHSMIICYLMFTKYLYREYGITDTFLSVSSSCIYKNTTCYKEHLHGFVTINNPTKKMNDRFYKFKNERIKQEIIPSSAYNKDIIYTYSDFYSLKILMDKLILRNISYYLFIGIKVIDTQNGLDSILNTDIAFISTGNKGKFLRNVPGFIIKDNERIPIDVNSDIFINNESKEVKKIYISEDQLIIQEDEESY
jgi:hypothetical protein